MGFGFDNENLKGESPFSFINVETSAVGGEDAEEAFSPEMRQELGIECEEHKYIAVEIDPWL